MGSAKIMLFTFKIEFQQWIGLSGKDVQIVGYPNHVKKKTNQSPTFFFDVNTLSDPRMIK
jgi:hypothetical protein